MLVNHDEALYDGMHRVGKPIEATVELTKARRYFLLIAVSTMASNCEP